MLDSSVSPAWYLKRVKPYHSVALLTIDMAFLVNKAFISARKTGRAKDR